METTRMANPVRAQPSRHRRLRLALAPQLRRCQAAYPRHSSRLPRQPYRGPRSLAPTKDRCRQLPLPATLVRAEAALCVGRQLNHPRLPVEAAIPRPQVLAAVPRAKLRQGQRNHPLQLPQRSRVPRRQSCPRHGRGRWMIHHRGSSPWRPALRCWGSSGCALQPRECRANN